MPSFKGSIAFGLVYIPVTLTAAAKPAETGFNLLHRKTGGRIKYVKTAEGVGEVKNEDIVKGYEYEKGNYVVFDDKDLEKLRAPQDRQIVVSSFVDVSEVDPVYYEKTYYVQPSGGEKAFALLLAAMAETGKGGLATATIGKRESPALLRAAGGRMYLTAMHYADEIVQGVVPAPRDAGSEAEFELAKKLISNMSEPFRPEKFKNEYRKRLEDAVAKKAAGMQIKQPRGKKQVTVTDLMDALKKSVERSDASGGRRRSGAKAARQR